MMGILWVVLLVALTGLQLGYGSPIRPTPQTYPHDASSNVFEGWDSESGLYAAIPALALVFTAVGLLFGCTWCYRHKDCKLFTASATHLHDARRSHPPDSGFSEPVNPNISEDNNNGPISLREMQNIANNNAATYIVTENEERSRVVSRESVVEFEPLPSGLRVVDPLERCADWFGTEDFPRNQLQYLREIGRGWFGRVVEGEIEDTGTTTSVAVKILNQNATLEDKARFLDESRVYRDVRHENILAFITKCLQEDPWILIFEFCPMDLQQYLVVNRPKMAILNESGVPLRLMCDVTSALAHLHSRGHLYGNLWSGSVLVRGDVDNARAVLGRYSSTEPQHDFNAPETRRPEHPLYTVSSEVWSLGTLIWEVCAWGSVPTSHPPPLPDLPCPYRNHLYQVMQLCWNPNSDARPTSAQVHALINHLYSTHTDSSEPSLDDGYGSSDFEERWQRLKPNTIPKIDEHVAIVHAPSTSNASHFTGSDHEFDNPSTIQDTLSIDMDTAVSRSSSLMSDKDPLSVQIKSESLTNLHGSLEDVRNIYLMHNEMAVLDCHQGNISLSLEDSEKEHDRSDSSVDPWLKDIIAGSQDDVSYYKDVSDVIKNLDNILNSEKTSSSESSHQASPSRDNLSLDCKRNYPMPSSMVKSPGISNFQNILDAGFSKSDENEPSEDDDGDRDTLGTLSHSFERHSDTISQETLENLTPETPIKDIDIASKVEIENKAVNKEIENNAVEHVKSVQETELPKDIVNSYSEIPKLKELCVASITSVSETNVEQSDVKDCKTSCDITVVITDIKEETKSINDLECQDGPNEVGINHTIKEGKQIDKESAEDVILPKTISETTQNNDGIDHNITAKALSNITLEMEVCKETNSLKPNFDDVLPDSYKNENSFVENEVNSDLFHLTKVDECDIVSNSNTNFLTENIECKKDDVEQIGMSEQTPESVQNIINRDKSYESVRNMDEIVEGERKTTILDAGDPTPLPIMPNKVQNNDEVSLVSEIITNINKQNVTNTEEDEARSENIEVINEVNEQINDSTAYMDLINDTNSEILNNEVLDNDVKDVIMSCLETSSTENACSLVKNESTVYLDLPSVCPIKESENFLQIERTFINNAGDVICASTPKGSDTSTDKTDSLENSVRQNENDLLSETKIPQPDLRSTLTKVEQKCVAEHVISPFESPSKSHHTDTYDENSSIVLGSFDNYNPEYFKTKTPIDPIDLPKEELLAFSSNFSEINLETPSPLRDGNFLNEVPDIVHEDIHFDDIEGLSEVKPLSEESENKSEDTEFSGTEKHVSPFTPPNSPGFFLASTSQQKYLIDIDLNASTVVDEDPGANLEKEIELNQIELQITSKLAMAENENNLNIEYSGPPSGESSKDLLEHESDVLPESFLAGNGGELPEVEDLREGLTLDEECVKALRNELELKLPLAQVAAIEPQCENEWSAELPPPPELVVSYPGALSPIAEETGHQLSAYENDANWLTHTESSESYPEPCNNSTDDVTDLPTGAHSGPNEQSTYSIPSKEHSQNHTYTVQKDVIASSKDTTMSADSLNASPYKKIQTDPESPIDDKTYNKNDEEKESNCERISQVSPFLLSPTTDTSIPESFDNGDNATGISTLSKTTVPTDAKLSKPSEIQCLSKATSIDSWCSNDTLYNVEENFDDLAMDPDLPVEFEAEKDEGNSESTDTLTHNEDEKEASHCSTYIINDSKSEVCETFSPDSISANDNYTYTKVKTEAGTATTPSVVTKSDVNDSKNTNSQTKDLAYGTLMSGLPSYSNCTTEHLSGLNDAWKLPQPEMVRKSPIGDEVNFTPPRHSEHKAVIQNNSPQLSSEPCIKKMDSVEISCIQDNMTDSPNRSDDTADLLMKITESPDYNYKGMAPSVTSTPITETCTEIENLQPIAMELSGNKTDSPDSLMKVPNFLSFQQSAEVRPQDLSPYTVNDDTRKSGDQETEIMLEGESQTLSRNSNKDSLVAERTPTYSDFEFSATTKPQDLHSKEKSSQSVESGISSEGFRQFEKSVNGRPQDLSSLIDASSLLLKSERISSDLAMGILSFDQAQTSQEVSRATSNEMQSLDISPPNITNLIESQNVVRKHTNNYLVNFVDNEETEQPHSIIITESSMNDFIESPNKTYDSHVIKDGNHTYDSHINKFEGMLSTDESIQPKLNGTDGTEDFNNDSEVKLNYNDVNKLEVTQLVNDSSLSENKNDTSNGTLVDEDEEIEPEETTCNGSEKFAIVNFISENFEELLESNVDDSDCKDLKMGESESSNVYKDSKSDDSEPSQEIGETSNNPDICDNKELLVAKEIAKDADGELETNGIAEVEDEKITSVTKIFLQNEKKYCQLDPYLPLLSDIRFTGPATEIMSTSFTQDSPTEATSPECDQDSKPNTVADIMKEWDSDSDSHSSNSSSGEFIWKDGDGRETSVVPSTHFDHQRGSGPQSGAEGGDSAPDGGAASDGSGDSGSGSEGDEVEFVPSSWDCRAAPSKSSLRSLEQTPPDSKKRVVFKRQKYHCVYEYPREVSEIDTHSPAYLPDLSTYSEWDPSSVEDAELGYGQLFGTSPLDLYPLRGGIADYDEDFFISSSARPFESLGIMSTTSQFFPGMHIKPSLLERELSDDITDDFPPPPSPLATTALVQTRTPSLDFTTPDSGVEDITPGSTGDDDYKAKRMPDTELSWRPADSASSSESVSPSSPGGEALGGLRHTRDKLKLDLPPSPHVPSPRHNRVFNFVLDKPKRKFEERSEIVTSPLVMTDETPIVTSALPLQKESDDLDLPEPTFSTFGKTVTKVEPEQKMVLTDDVEENTEVKEESPKVVEAVKGEGTVLDSGDEDSGIESSSKATLERNKTSNVS